VWGYSRSAQFAKRLVLRKPQYFRAAYLHIPSSFDQPTPEAASVLWCLTTGECESGYLRSMKFVRQCRKLGYPMVYKAVPGLGHTDHTPARILGLQVFEYARSLPADRAQRADQLKRDTAAAPFFSDYLNQVMEPADRSDWMPKNLKFPMYTPLIARAWLMNPDNPAPDPSPPAAPEPVVAAKTDPASTEGLPDFVLPEVKIVHAPMDPWADYRVNWALMKQMRAMGVAFTAPTLPDIPVPAEQRDAVDKLIEEAEINHATDLKLAAAMRATGQTWPDPELPSLLVARDKGQLSSERKATPRSASPSTTPTPTPAKPPETPLVAPEKASEAQPEKPADSPFGRPIR